MFNWTVFKKLNQSNSAKKMSTIFFIMFGVWSVSIFFNFIPLIFNTKNIIFVINVSNVLSYKIQTKEFCT